MSNEKEDGATFLVEASPQKRISGNHSVLLWELFSISFKMTELNFFIVSGRIRQLTFPALLAVTIHS